MASLPYSRQAITQMDIDAVADVLRSPFLTQGPAVERFERAVADLHQVAHALAMSNATCALHIACLALGAGPGVRVWTVSTSFVASANCALYCGATIDFVDIDPATRLLSVEALADKLAAAEREGTLPGIVIPVDLTGLPCDYAAIRQLADRYGFKVLADCSHALGASYDSRPVASDHVDIAVFSFHAVKVITTGEGGMAVTQDAELADRMRLLHSHGITRDPARMQEVPPAGYYYEQLALGYNYRMTDIQAALGLSQLARLPEMAAERQALADRYDALLHNQGWLLPARLEGRRSAWHLYVVEREDGDPAARDLVFNQMREAEIGVNLHYLPIHLQPLYRGLGFGPGTCPHAERYGERAMSIPLFPAMSHAEQDRVVALLGEGR